MMKRITIFLILFLLCSKILLAQGENYLWLAGYENYPSGSNIHSKMILDFANGTLHLDSALFEMRFNISNTSICDTSGQLQFYTNGVYLANAFHDTMANGNDINPGDFTNTWINSFGGLPLIQGQLILPYPGNHSIYALIHITLYYDLFYHSDSLFYSIIDMSQNGGLGAVTSKKNLLGTDTLISGAINACRHANGRDWWILTHSDSSDTYIKYLFTPSGFLGPYYQNIGNQINFASNHQSSFSPDGSRYAYFNTDINLDLFDFDRCTGMLSNAHNILVGSNAGAIGVSFSPNSRFMYASTGLKLKQYDCLASNVAASGMNVAVWDSFYSPAPPFATTFFTQQLAADGKIYVGCSNGTQHIHYINYPDSLGLACDVHQHSVYFPYFISIGGVCYQPNYHLGALTGSPCDTLTSANDALSSKNKMLRVLQNPNDGNFSVLFSASPQPQTIEVINSLGSTFFTSHIAPYSTTYSFRLGNIASGVYLLRINDGDEIRTAKFVKV